MIMTTTHSRFALGVCVLSAGLLIGSAGGAVAAADPEAGGSTASSEGADGSTQSVSSATGQVESTADTGTSESSIDSTKVESARPPGPMILTVTTIIEKHVAAVTKQLKEATGSTAAAATGGTSDPDVGVAQPTVVASPTPVAASDSNVIAPVVNPLVAVRAVAPLVTTAVAPAAQAITSIPGVVASLPTSATPVTDVITAVQDALTSVAASGIAIAQLPSDLASLLGFPKGIAPGVIGGTLSAAGLSATRDEPVLPSPSGQSPQIPATSGYWGTPSAGDADGPPLLGSYATSSLSQDMSVTGAAAVASEGIAPTGVLSSFEHTVSAVLVPASLVALAALALPGIGGLLIISGAGMLVGYRQAKAASSLRAAGIARFARVGPLGVVRSGSLIALHQRTPSGICRRTSRASPLERVA
jgi:hypothetical protein